MKFFIVVLLVGVASASLVSDEELNSRFFAFKNDFGRTYASSLHEQARKAIFAENYEFIVKHNMEADIGLHSFRVGINNFTDLTNAEFVKIFNGFKHNAVSGRSEQVFTGIDAPLPATVDWRTKGYVTPVKDQGQCGSCWAFSAVASMEGQHFKKTGKLVSLSEQNLVDCSGPEGDYGCEGGLMDNAFTYVIQNHGVDTEASYPYQAVDAQCRFKKNEVGATISSFVDIKKFDENALKAAVATIGPISVAIDASQLSFQLYKSGVYDEPNCSQTVLDHGVTAVGYGTLNGKDYWLVKNSWNTVWGIKGYILMSRNKNNQCGIATAASYPVV